MADHMIQIYVERKAKENQWRVMVLEESLHTALLYRLNNQYCTWEIFGGIKYWRTYFFKLKLGHLEGKNLANCHKFAIFALQMFPTYCTRNINVVAVLEQSLVLIEIEFIAAW